jgi:hypothetical protein
MVIVIISRKGCTRLNPEDGIRDAKFDGYITNPWDKGVVYKT